MNIKMKIEVARILKNRGLGTSNKARRHLAVTVARLSDSYVPMQQGTLKDSRQILEGGRAILYNQPYAHYQYHGQVMAGRAPKHYTGQPIHYHYGRHRGKEWDKRMLANRGKEVVEDLARFVGGKRK